MTAAPATPGSDPDELARRTEAVRATMRERGLAALCLVSPENVYYLSGLNHHGHFAFTMLVVPLDERPRLVTRAMERPTVAAQVPGCLHVTFGDDEDPAEAAAGAVRHVTRPGDRVGVEQASMFLPVAVWERMRARLSDRVLADGSGLVEVLRAAKSPAEVTLVRQAAAISDRALQAGIAAARPGATERDIASAVYSEMLRAGSEHPALPPLIRARDLLRQEHVIGLRDRALAADDAVFMELSASVGRYHAPLSRMVYLGQPPDGTAQAAKIALAGLEAVRDALRPGAVSGDVYDTWQRVVDDGLGHSRYRRHHCGYVIGIGFSPCWVAGTPVGLRAGSDLRIRDGMVFHVLSWILDQAPADYVVSDTVLVTASGGELLTTTPREPTIVS